MEEFQQIAQRSIKLTWIHKTLHLRDYIDRLDVSRKEGESGLISIEDIMDALIQEFMDNIKMINYCDQKQQRQHNNQQINNN